MSTRTGRRAVRALGAAGLVAALAVSGLTVPGPGGAPVAAAATCPMPGGVAVAEVAQPAGEVVFQGHGYGHGIGMSQYGAQGAARLGCSYSTILQTYYQGTTVTTRSMPLEVRLWLLRGGTHADTTVESGSVGWTFCAPTCVTVATQPADRTWRTSASAGKLRLVEGSTVKWTATVAGTLVARHSGSVVRVATAGGSFVADRRLRWDETRYTVGSDGRVTAVQAIKAGPVDGVTRTAMDKYLFGLAEVPLSWPAESLKAQVTAARTFGARKLAGSTTAVLYPTTADQYYTGYALEAQDASLGHTWRAAVLATTGKAVVDPTGALATTMYSSSTGGWSEDSRYSIGGSGATYLRAVDDSRWNAASDDPKRSWAVGFSRSAVATALGFSSITGITVAPRGTDARWQQGVVVTGTRSGSAVTTSFTGNALRTKLGMWSPGFTVRLTSAGAASQPLAGDWDGDGRTDVGWFTDGNVALRWPDGTLRRYTYGRRGDLAVVGDWNGDGKDTVGVVRAGTWLLRDSLTAGAPSYAAFTWGRPGDRPLAGDWAARGKDGIALYTGGRWVLRASPRGTPDGDRVLVYGSPGDQPVLGDWNGDGTDTVGILRVSRWSLLDAVVAGGTSYTVGYGTRGDRAVAGDWDGDGDATVGVVRGTSWYQRSSSTNGGTTTVVSFAG